MEPEGEVLGYRCSSGVCGSLKWRVWEATGKAVRDQRRSQFRRGRRAVALGRLRVRGRGKAMRETCPVLDPWLR